MSRRKLPLEDSRWWPILAALRHRSERVGADQLAIWDFNKALKAGQLRAMARRRDGCEVLAASAWNDFYVTPTIRLTPGSSGRYRMRVTGMTVWSHKLGGRIIPFHWFFVWKPDYEKIFLENFSDAATEPAKPHAPSQEMPENRGRKRVHDRADLQSVALVLALQRKRGAPEKRPIDIVNELREWCPQNNRKVPVDSTLYEIVAAALQLKPTLKF